MKAVRQMFSALSIVFGLVGMAAPAAAQTCAWSGLGLGVNGPASALTAFDEPSDVHALALFDDGSGPALYAGGSFTRAGGVAANRIARWDGTQWSPLASGIEGVGSFPVVSALAVFDDGRGAALYAGGRFTTAGGVEVHGIARWDGTQWSALGSGLTGGPSSGPVAYALTVFDDGSGPALYAGGSFTIAGGVEVNRIAKWDGAQWSALGSGMGPSTSSVSALTVFDDGSGLALFAGGSFTVAGGQEARGIARWDGTQWSAVGGGIGGGVSSLTIFDDGSGPALYAGGFFFTAGGEPANHIAKWDGARWSALGSGMDSGVVAALTVFNDGSGPALYAGGDFNTAGGISANHIAKWDGARWSALVSGGALGVGGRVFALTVFDGGTGPALYTGGFFIAAGPTVVDSIAKWDGAQWSALGSGVASHLLYAGGSFTQAGGVAANRIARWDGTQWSPLGSGVGSGPNSYVNALTAFDDGRGLALYAGGSFTIAGGVPANHIARWDGTQWSIVGSGMGDPSYVSVAALAVFDDGSGPALYAGGHFTTAGGVTANGIARWDGTRWSALGSGLSFPGFAYALTVFDDGSGPALYVGGSFTSVGGAPGTTAIAKWNGTQWSAVGQGIASPGLVLALTAFDDGRGPALYAAGDFGSASGVPVNNIARWDGAHWSALGSGVGGSTPAVRALTVFDNGRGPALYAGGDFTVAGDYDALRIAQWGGAQWLPLQGGGANNSIDALTVFDDGSGGALYAGGTFTLPASSIAKWRCQ